MVCKEPVKVPDKHIVNQLKQGTEQKDEMTIWTIAGGPVEGYHIHLKLNNKPTNMELDTGAAVSVMSNQQWKRMFDDTRSHACNYNIGYTTWLVVYTKHNVFI